MRGKEQAKVAELSAAYLAADYRWGQGSYWHAVHIGAPVPEIEAAFADAAGFGMLSAWNPRSVQQTDTVNQAADDVLQAALKIRGVDYRPGFAAATNRSWREPNWVVINLPLAELDALARRFGQLGTLHWRRGEPARLRMYAAKPAEVADHDHVDWLE